MIDELHSKALRLGRKLTDEVLAPIKQTFVGKDDIIDLLGICLVARENLFILGPPGTAKSALVQALARRIEGQVFDYLLTRFTEPNEIFGPFDIRKLREGDLITNTEGMLPEATFVFLDELLNANSAILNSLLLVLNERLFRRGRETRTLPTLMVVGASNRLPEDDAIGALFDRFLLRVRCDNVEREELEHVLTAGWSLDARAKEERASIGMNEVQELHGLLQHVNLTPVRQRYVELIHRLRHAGIQVSDRRAVKFQRILAASAILCGRLEVNTTDMWVLRYIWDTEEQQDVLASIINEVLESADESEKSASHPRSQTSDTPDPEHLSNSLDHLSEALQSDSLAPSDRSYLRDELGLLSARCEWVADEQQREFLQGKINSLFEKLGEPA